MHEVITASVAFPSVIYTLVLSLALIYWFFVILGALDLDILGSAGGEGVDVDLDLDGVAKGALEGATKGALEGAVKGTLEGAADGGGGDIDAPEDGGIGAVFASLQLNRAPATVVLTILAAFGWLISVLGMMTLTPLWTSWSLGRWLLGALVLIVSFILALPLTSLAVRPLGPLFATRAAKSRMEVVGSVCIISTGRVDERFGQATLADGGAGLILDVRCDEPDALRRGDRALIVSWDSDKEAFMVEPHDALMGSKGRGNPTAAADPAPKQAATPPSKEDANPPTKGVTPSAKDGALDEDEAQQDAPPDRSRGQVG